MNVTFLSDYQGAETGNELYRRGDTATLDAAEHLIALGIAVSGWGIPAMEPESSTTQDALAGEPAAKTKRGRTRKSSE